MFLESFLGKKVGDAHDKVFLLVLLDFAIGKFLSSFKLIFMKSSSRFIKQCQSFIFHFSLKYILHVFPLTLIQETDHIFYHFSVDFWNVEFH